MSARDWLLSAWKRKAPDVAGAYQALFGRKDWQAELVLADLGHYCNFARSSFVPGQPETAIFNEGQRDAFLHILEMAGVSAEQMRKLMVEVGR